jgi:Tfp pilus assembly protein PilO
MSAGNWIAIASAMVAFLGLLTGFVVLAVQVAFRFGEHHSRLTVVERDTAELKTAGKEAADAISKISGMSALLTELRADVKRLLMNRQAPQRDE